ncbi:hypothetical protein JTE90_026362 [Oedothorax gibbosus]|uniref:Uncharacterized protein n=1 Tax=Oedothorax gibbosus TaxID=931172 RepID=A0AAV6UJH9_9ARAC|nr:hypothetical protein JTE90_026362 [Oedothorax gibbosus]
MNPATQEYFHTYQTLKDELSTYKNQQTQMKLQVSKLLDENKRLYAELKDTARRYELESSVSGCAELKNKLDAAVVAKNAAVEMWQLALAKMEEQELQLVGKRSIVETERSEAEKVVDKIKEEYVQGLNVLSSEVTTYRGELSDALRELRLKTSDLEKCRSDLETALEGQVKAKQTITELEKAKEELQGTVESLTTMVSETKTFLTKNNNEITSLKTKNEELSSLVSDLREQNKNLRSEAKTLEKDAKNSLITAQEAILRRKEMSYKEEQYLKDIEHLKSTINIEAEKVGLKHKAEMRNMQKDAAEKVKALMDEIETLHREIGERQSLFERATREKQALESKLELLYSECSSSAGGGVSEELCRRLTIAERERDEQEFRARALEADLQEMKSSKEQELHCANEERDSLQLRLQKVLEDFDRSSLDRLQLSEEVTRLKKACYGLEKELKRTSEKDAKDISSLREELRRAEASFEQRLKFHEERYKKACAELRSLLDAEFGISNKLKEVLDDVIVQSEAKIKELQQTIIHLQNHNKELSNSLMQDVYVPNYGLTMDR